MIKVTNPIENLTKEFVSKSNSLSDLNKFDMCDTFLVLRYIKKENYTSNLVAKLTFPSTI